MPADARWQRSYDRYDVKFRVTLSYGKTEKTLSGDVLNIGRGGAFIAAPPPYPRVNEHISFHIQFDDKNYPELKGTGVCRWTKKTNDAGLGIEFSYVEPELYPNLLALLNQLHDKLQASETVNS